MSIGIVRGHAQTCVVQVLALETNVERVVPRCSAAAARVDAMVLIVGASEDRIRGIERVTQINLTTSHRIVSGDIVKMDTVCAAQAVQTPSENRPSPGHVTSPDTAHAPDDVRRNAFQGCAGSPRTRRHAAGALSSAPNWPLYADPRMDDECAFYGQPGAVAARGLAAAARTGRPPGACNPYTHRSRANR